METSLLTHSLFFFQYGLKFFNPAQLFSFLGNTFSSSFLIRRANFSENLFYLILVTVLQRTNKINIGLSNRHLFPQTYEDWKSKIQVPGEASPPGLQRAASPCVLTWRFLCVQEGRGVGRVGSLWRLFL